MSIQQTSIDAFVSIQPNLGKKQQELYELFKEKIVLYDSLAAHLLNWEINIVTARRNELEKKGLIKKICPRMSIYSGKMVNQYKIWGYASDGGMEIVCVCV